MSGAWFRLAPARHAALSILADSLPYLRHGQTSRQDNAAAGRDTRRRSGSPLTDYPDASEPLHARLREAPQAELSGTPLTGSISDWAEQIEREGGTESPP